MNLDMQMQSGFKCPEQQHAILIIDDDSSNLATMTSYLSDCSYTILVAESGTSGLERAAYARPDLILLDIMMPGMDGYETCRRLKGREETRNIPVILMTDLSETERNLRGFEAGAVDYLVKPLQREEALARVSVHLHIQELAKGFQEAKDSLEKRVEERTRELEQANSQLQAEIAERKQIEKERELLVTAIDQAAEAVVITDDQWKINYVNPAFRRLTGFNRFDTIGHHINVLRSDYHDVEFYRNIRETITNSKAWSGRIKNQRLDGSYYDAEVTISPVRDQAGIIKHFVNIQRDITAELKLEHDLRQAQKMEAIGTLAGGIAHDFNNILTAIIGFTEMSVQMLADTSPVRKNLEQVLTAGNRAAEMVRQILTFSRQSEEEQKPMLLTPVIKEVLKLLRSLLPSSIQITQEIKIVHGEDMILADPTHIHQVLMNLSTNASHAMQKNGGTLKVTLTSVGVDDALAAMVPGLSPGAHLMLTVSDTGHGMDASVIERIFEPYYTTKAPGEGTGMGLAVVMGILKNYGWAISVQSEPGIGTTVQVYFNMSSDEKINGFREEEPLPGGSEHILFVDDERSLTVLGREMLEALGYRITVNISSSEALEIFRAQPASFDLVITDMTMPFLNGLELSREIMAVRPEIPIILCSGFSEVVNAEQAKELGISEFLMKPYVAGNLARTIRRVLEEC